MMGTIVLSMLLGWFGAIAVLTVFSGKSEEPRAEDSTTVAAAPQGASEEASAGIGV
jgi:hypothetical protein